MANLIALCSKHHDIVDAREDIYTVERLTTMKTEHEEKVENSADRSWLKRAREIGEFRLDLSVEVARTTVALRLHVLLGAA